MAKPVFSGHESFACKSHWLKRGYDFVNEGNNFNADDAVVQLGVGKIWYRRSGSGCGLLAYWMLMER